jgi:glycosyltransferase involved in cell wall biosynthesis
VNLRFARAAAFEEVARPADQAPLRVAIDAWLADGQSGGVQQSIIGLAAALSQLDDGDERYAFLGRPGEEGWLLPYLTGPCHLMETTTAMAARAPRHRIRQIRRAVGQRLPAARTAWRRLVRARRRGQIVIPSSDGTVEAAGVAVVHFTFQEAFITDVPSIYQPWDLQHLHLPEFFTDDQRRWREVAYPLFCERAELVIVASEWAKQDVVRRLGIPPSKIAIVEMPPVVSAYPVPDAATVERIRLKLGLPPRFIFYPAQTWPHKNHIRLFEAIALIRDRHGLDIDVVCSGSQNAHFAEIERTVRRLGLQDRVRFLGFVAPIEIQSLYRLARCMVFPSLFEGWGLPVVEAFSLGLPVACSNVTSLPAMVGDAALLFDPRDVDAMAEATLALWQDEGLRATLASRGYQVVGRFDWGRTARTFRAHYRSIGGHELTPDDRQLFARSMGASGR